MPPFSDFGAFHSDFVQMAHKCSTEVLSSVPIQEKCDVSLENICVRQVINAKLWSV